MTAKKKKTVRKKKTDPVTPSLRLSGIVLVMLAGMLLVLGARANAGEQLHLSDLYPYALWLLSALFLAGSLRIAKYSGPRSLPEFMLLLSVLGVLVRSRMEGNMEGGAGWSLFVQPLGFVWMWMAWVMSRKGRVLRFQPLWGLAFLAALGIVAGLIVLGSRFRGAFYGPGGLTPSELLKLLIPLALAGYFAGSSKQWQGRGIWNPPFIKMAGLGVGWGLLCALLVLQRDLGLLVLLSVMLVVMFIAVTRSWSWGVLFVAALSAGGWLVMQTMDHGARRLQGWLDPFADPTGAGWQVLQGLSGLYAGGLTGTGLGGGRPDRLPIAGSDFVYAVYGEELGYLGCLILLGLFALLLRRCAGVANAQQDPFAGFFATGLTAVIAVQVFVNIAGVVTLLPITGITLPYISQGGSSIWVTSVQFGLLLGMAEPGKAARSKPKKKTT